MLSNNEHYGLLEKLDGEEGEWWGSYTEALTEDDDWEMEDAAVLAIAYLVESGRLTYKDVAKATQVLKQCSSWDIGKAAFIERVMKDADEVRARGGF